MNLSAFNLLTDQNVHPRVVAFLRVFGFDVLDVCEQALQGTDDVTLLRLSNSTNRLVVTHDADFGTMAVLNREPVLGIIYLRPGHINPQFTIDTLVTVLNANPDVAVPFLLVAKRTRNAITIRVRQLP